MLAGVGTVFEDIDAENDDSLMKSWKIRVRLKMLAGVGTVFEDIDAENDDSLMKSWKIRSGQTDNFRPFLQWTNFNCNDRRAQNLQKAERRYERPECTQLPPNKTPTALNVNRKRRIDMLPWSLHVNELLMLILRAYNLISGDQRTKRNVQDLMAAWNQIDAAFSNIDQQKKAKANVKHPKGLYSNSDELQFTVFDVLRGSCKLPAYRCKFKSGMVKTPASNNAVLVVGDALSSRPGDAKAAMAIHSILQHSADYPIHDFPHSQHA
uniref:Uncharacterized protein n=1 Tax=Ascaris lumbricoides TaxID=6252 RepID=A0A9J2PGJ0_ASCLU